MDTLEQIASNSCTGTSFSGTVQYDLGVMQMYSGWAQPPSMLPMGDFQPQIGSAGYGHSPVPYAQNLPSAVDINSYGFHMPARQKPTKPIIYDLPSVGGQVHLHENDLGITGGRLYPYDRNSDIFKALNACEGAMLDFYAKNLQIDKK